jgi:hypothetical protein
MIQDVLGEIQDTEVLGAVVTDILAQEISQVMPTLAQQLTETRYQLWQQWAPLYDRYINPETRQAFRTALLHPGSETPTVHDLPPLTPPISGGDLPPLTPPTSGGDRTPDEKSENSPVAEDERSSLEANPDTEKPNKSKKKNKNNHPSD